LKQKKLSLLRATRPRDHSKLLPGGRGKKDGAVNDSSKILRKRDEADEREAHVKADSGPPGTPSKGKGAGKMGPRTKKRRKVWGSVNHETKEEIETVVITTATSRMN